MRVSAGLIGAALLLFGIQLGFSDGAEPNIMALPIGMLPLTVGAMALLAGLVLGALLGNRRYRLAIGLALLGTSLAAFAIVFVTAGGPGQRQFLNVNEMSMIAAAVTWLAALVVGFSALRSRETAT